LIPRRNRNCSSDEKSNSSDSETESKSRATSSCLPYRESAQHNSSEDDVCNVERDSDYEYFHTWGESDSGQSDFQAGDDIRSGDETEFLEQTQPLEKLTYERDIPDYDTVSPEPFLPEPSEEDLATNFVRCVHEIANCDVLAFDLMTLSISNSPDMRHVNNSAPPFIEEQPVCDFSDEIESHEVSNPPAVRNISLKRKQPLLDLDLLEKAASHKVARLEVLDTQSKSSDKSAPSPTPSSAPSFSPPHCDDVYVGDECSNVGLKDLTCIKNPSRRNLKLNMDSQIMSPFPSPASDLDSPVKYSSIANTPNSLLGEDGDSMLSNHSYYST